MHERFKIMFSPSALHARMVIQHYNVLPVGGEGVVGGKGVGVLVRMVVCISAILYIH